MTPYRLRLLAVAATSAAAWAQQVSASPSNSLEIMPAAQVAPSAGKEVDAIVRREMNERRIPGLQLAVVKDGSIVLSRAYGIENISTQAAVSEKSLFPINSITKAFTGVEIVSLAEKGKINLDMPVSTYLTNLPTSWGRVTLDQLLSHTSGLPELVNDNAQLFGGGDEHHAWAAVKMQPLHFAPGTKFEYCQTNYALLQEVLERTTGLPYAGLIYQDQSKIAGLTSTSVQYGSHTAKRQVPTYTFLRLKMKGFVTVGVEKTDHLMMRHEPIPYSIEAAGGIVSTADDLARWVIALQRNEIITSKDALSELWRPRPLTDGTFVGLDETADAYAAGWPIILRKMHPAYSPEGGERAAVFMYPKDGVSVIVLTNLMGASPQTFIDSIASVYIPGLSAPP